MSVCIIQHVAFETAGCLQPLLQARGMQVKLVHPYAGDPLPDTACQHIVLMGGPMSVHDVQQHPWLTAEKAWLRRQLDAGSKVLGVCLGAQLLAEALGGEVIAGNCREIGWFPVQRVTTDARWMAVMPDTFTAFHWHGETFTLPAGAQWLLRSEAYAHQAFAWRHQVLALQCHLEVDDAAIARLCRQCADELDNSRWVQSADKMTGTAHVAAARQVLEGMVACWLKT